MTSWRWARSMPGNLPAATGSVQAGASGLRHARQRAEGLDDGALAADEGEHGPQPGGGVGPVEDALPVGGVEDHPLDDAVRDLAERRLDGLGARSEPFEVGAVLTQGAGGQGREP